MILLFILAKELVKRHCSKITLLARGEAKLAEAKIILDNYAETLKSETKISTYSVDVTDANAVEKIAEKICKNENSPSILFNVAGTSSSGEFLETHIGEFERLMKINYLGTVYTVRAFLPHMLGHGNTNKSPKTIVFTSSAGMCFVKVLKIRYI